MSGKCAVNGKVHIGVDARSLNLPFVRGIGSYLRNMLLELVKSDDFRFTLFGDRPEYAICIPESDLIRHEVFEVRGDRFSAWEQFGFPSRAKKLGADVLFCPGTSAPLWQPLPTVVTIHDALCWEAVSLSGWNRFFLNRVLPRAYGKCKEVITISQSSKSDIEKRFPHLRDRCQVIYHGLDSLFQSAQISEGVQQGKLPQVLWNCKYVLYVGGPIPRKRPEWAVGVFLEAMPDDVKLVVLGVGAEDHGLFRSQMPHGVGQDRVVLLPYQSDESVVALYSEAMAVLYPTLYEGFGFPVLQANAVNTPVLHSAVGSLKELVGPASIVLEPDSFSSWVNRLKECAVAGERAHLGQDWARRFSWEQSSGMHRELFLKSLQR